MSSSSQPITTNGDTATPSSSSLLPSQSNGSDSTDNHPAWMDESACPVPHAKSQPLPPGHPPVPDALPSTLYPPTDARCIFFRSPEDLGDTPPLSRSNSSSQLSGPATPSLPSLYEQALTHSASAAEFDRAQKLDQARKEANINPLPSDRHSQLSLKPDFTLVLASRNSQLALVQSSHVSAMLEARYGVSSPLFNHSHSSQAPQATHAQPQPQLQPGPSTVKLDSIDFSDDDLAHVRQLLQSFQQDSSVHPTEPFTFPITSMSTAGDQNLRSPLYVIGGEGKAIWTKELEVALEQGAVDAIVHCLKDVPTAMPNGLEIAAILEREDPRDALVVKKGLPYRVLDELPPGSVIGTSSVRRVAQLRRRYPHLVFSDVRGNLNTRLAKLDAPNGPYTALVLAAAGLVRLNLHDRITAFLSSPVLLYSVGQGSLAIEVRTPPEGATPQNNRDARIRELIRSIGDWRSTLRAEAERALLRQLEGGCSIPVGVQTHFDDHDQVEGKRNEAIDYIDDAVCAGNKDAKAQLPNGGVPLVREGHTIPANQLVGLDSKNGSLTAQDDSNTLVGAGGQKPIPPPLERLATGNVEVNGAASQSSQAAAEAQPKKPTLAEKIVSTRMSISNRSIPAATSQRLHLDAIVVSLDGTRSSRFCASKVCETVEDARALGIQVAHELAEKHGARSILEEVERHRKMAEAADRKRREEARKRKAMGEPGGEPRPVQSTTGDLSKKGRDGWMRGQAEISLAAEVEAVRNDASSFKAPDWDPQEIDRRFVPRDDGQPKAWEV